MTATVDQIYQDASRLNETDRAELVDRLIDTLEPNDMDAELKKTIKRWLAEIENGTAKGRPVEEFIEKLRTRVSYNR